METPRPACRGGLASNRAKGDLLGLQQLDQVRPGHVEELGCLLGGQLGRVGHDIHALAGRQVAQDLGEQDRRLPRHDQGVIAREFALDRDRAGARVQRQVLPDASCRALSKLCLPAIPGSWARCGNRQE